MKITKVEAFTKNLALTKPYTIAYKTISDVENVFLLITLENGITGIGAANPDTQVVGENPAQVLLNCESDYCQSFVGRDIRHFRLMIQEIAAAYPGKPGTLAAWDIALHDTFGKYMEMPVVDFYGRHIESLPTSVTIGIMDVEDTVNEAREFVNLGFKVLKVKMGQDVELDIERIKKIHEYNREVIIRVDANQGYDADDLHRFIKATAGLGLELIEQPVAVGKEDLLSSFDEESRRLLVADESLKNSTSAIKFADTPQLFGNYNIKLMKCGGLMGAFDIATIAKAAGISLFWGCNDESIVSITAALHAAFACPHTKYIDLDGSLDLAEDIVTGGFILEDGVMSIRDKAGFGFELN
ncbi:MAG: dipeptide epimerase [Bacteroidetes bacterium]|nr:MAG: dipeptide epimerase [Bacteroidota bacterium]